MGTGESCARGGPGRWSGAGTSAGQNARMRSVQDHLAAVLAAVGPVAPLDVVLRDATGCVLAADVVAAADTPPFALAGTDGYAVASADTRDVDRLPVAHDVRPGAGGPLRLVPGQAVRVASGAPLPLGADAVVSLDRTDRGGVTVAFQAPATPGEHVRPAAGEAKAGDVVLRAGTRLGARQLALCAALGRARVPVHPTPRVVLLSVGDELVEPGGRAEPGQVCEADGHALESAVRDAGASAVRTGIVGDDRAVLRETLEDQLVRADLVITTGGLSEPAHDTVKDVLALLGDVRFDQVAMTPGRRHGFGLLDAGERRVPVFALPGSPAAALVAFEVFVRPALRTMAGRAMIYRPSVAARVRDGWTSPLGLRQFVPATVVGQPDEGYTATVLGDPGAPSLAAIARADAFVVVGETERVVAPGRVLQCLVLES